MYIQNKRPKRVRGNISGRWNVVCDRCGLWYHNIYMKEEKPTYPGMKGVLVCPMCFDPPNPLNKPIVKTEYPPPDKTRPPPSDGS